MISEMGWDTTNVYVQNGGVQVPKQKFTNTGLFWNVQEGYRIWHKINCVVHMISSQKKKKEKSSVIRPRPLYDFGCTTKKWKWVASPPIRRKEVKYKMFPLVSVQVQYGEHGNMHPYNFENQNLFFICFKCQNLLLLFILHGDMCWFWTDHQTWNSGIL